MAFNPRHIKLNNVGPQAFLNSIELAVRNAQSQRTSNSGTHFIPSGEINEDGLPKGTLIGPGAQNGSITPWVNDTTPPGKPQGLSVSSSASMIYITWDGTIEGGTPPDFDYLQIYVDGKETVKLNSQGTAVAGPYEVDSKHNIYAIAWDNAHDSSGAPKPNGSVKSEPLDIVVSSSEIDPSQFGGTITESEESPQGDGVHKGDLWIKYGLEGTKKVRSEEWWWDGSAWQPLPMAMYLDQLAARDVQIDTAVIGALSTGIIQSGTFVTPDGLVGLDSSGFWVKDKNGVYKFLANATGIYMTGVFRTANPDEARYEISQKNINTPTGEKRSIGTIYFFSYNRPNTPSTSIESWDTGTVSTISMNVNKYQSSKSLANISLSSVRNETNAEVSNISLEGDQVSLGEPAGTSIEVIGSNANVSQNDTINLQSKKDINFSHNGNIKIQNNKLPMVGMAFNGYKARDGAWEISFQSIETECGETQFALANCAIGRGLQIPATGYWRLTGGVNVSYPSGVRSIYYAIFNPKDNTTKDCGRFVADFATSANTWISQTMIPYIAHIEKGEVVLLRSDTSLSVGGGMNLIHAELLFS